MDKKLEKDLQDVMNIISSNWKIQDNYYDKETNFIYNVNSLKECMEEIERRGCDKEYALHRWYNYKTSLQCEYIFCEYGAVHEENIFNHDVDVFIYDVPFDIKLTVYPIKLSSRPYNLSTRVGKNQMIRWYYKHQSQEGRKQLLN